MIGIAVMVLLSLFGMAFALCLYSGAFKRKAFTEIAVQEEQAQNERDTKDSRTKDSSSKMEHQAIPKQRKGSSPRVILMQIGSVSPKGGIERQHGASTGIPLNRIQSAASARTPVNWQHGASTGIPLNRIQSAALSERTPNLLGGAPLQQVSIVSNRTSFSPSQCAGQTPNVSKAFVTFPAIPSMKSSPAPPVARYANGNRLKIWERLKVEYGGYMKAYARLLCI